MTRETRGRGASVRIDVLHTIYERARAAEATVILPEAQDARIKEAVHLIEEKNLARLILIDGNHTSEYFGNVPTGEQEKLVMTVHDARRGKKDALSLEQARELLSTDSKYLAAAMVKTGKADGFLAGSLCETAETILPAVKIIGTSGGYASSFFIMQRDDETLFFADCGFNIEPNAEQLAKIAIDTACNAQALGMEPKVAFLSFSTGMKTDYVGVVKIRDAIERMRHAAPDVAVGEHEMQFDAAYVPKIGKRKAPKSEVAGNANVFIFPDLTSGNIAYKIAERLGSFRAIGPIFQGFNAAVNDLSRGCSVGDIVDMVAVTAMQAGTFKRTDAPI